MTALELRAGITAVVLMELINLLVIASQDLEESSVKEVCFLWMLCSLKLKIAHLIA